MAAFDTLFGGFRQRAQRTFELLQDRRTAFIVVAAPEPDALREHMRRLVDSAKIYRIPVRWSVDELVQAAVDTVGANELRHCYLRPLVIRTGEQMGVYGMDVPVETYDERFTTSLAARAAGDAPEDARAAAHLLESYLAWKSAPRS